MSINAGNHIMLSTGNRTNVTRLK